MIVFDRVTKKFPSGVVAIRDINLEIKEGEFVFLVGPSGVGKTTILRLIIADIFPTQGAIFVDNLQINRLKRSQLPFLRRKVGFVFQDFKLLSDRTVGENIAVTLEILDKSKKEIEKQVDKILETVRLGGKKNYFPRQLSFGEQQRIALGRAIAGEAKIVLADEPTGNLDPKTSWEILKIMNDINKSGITLVIATHNVDIVSSLKKRVVRLSEGKILRDEKKSKY